MKMSQIYSDLTLLPTKKAGLCHSVLAGNSRMIALYTKGIVQNMEDHSKDLQNACTQHLLAPRKSCP